MTRLALLAALLSASAFAQSVQVNMDPNGMNMTVDDPEAPAVRGSVKSTSSQVISESGNDYQLKYVNTANGNTELEVLEPEGLRVQFFEGNSLVATDDAPTSQQLKSNVWYRVEVTAPNGAVWSKKIQAKAGMHGTLRVMGPNGGSTKIVINTPAPTPPAPPPAPAKQGMASGDFEALKAAIEGESFSDGKLGVLRQAAQHADFTVNQVGALVDLFDFSNDKLAAVRIAKDAGIVDPQNNFKLSSHFTFANDKQQLSAMLAE